MGRAAHTAREWPVEFVEIKVERCLSGLRSALGKRVCWQRYRGFKSPPLRHFNERAAVGSVPGKGGLSNRVRPGTEQP